MYIHVHVFILSFFVAFVQISKWFNSITPVQKLCVGLLILLGTLLPMLRASNGFKTVPLSSSWNQVTPSIPLHHQHHNKETRDTWNQMRLSLSLSPSHLVSQTICTECKCTIHVLYYCICTCTLHTCTCTLHTCTCSNKMMYI